MAASARPSHSQADPPTLGEYEGFVIYPMPVFARIAATDVARTVEFFTGVLDFEAMFRGPEIGGLPTLVHVRRRKYQDVLIVPARGPVTSGDGLVVTFGAADADDIDALAERVRGASPAALDGPVDTPWNTRELTVADPDGHRITFTAQARDFRPGLIDDLMRPPTDADRPPPR
jgi:catechol 2,3-dioxygenase-like lactoylglutathione lyase family enzyme